MKKRVQKVEEPAAIYYPAKPTPKRHPTGEPPTRDTFQSAVDKVFTERKELLRKLAQ